MFRIFIVKLSVSSPNFRSITLNNENTKTRSIGWRGFTKMENFLFLFYEMESSNNISRSIYCIYFTENLWFLYRNN